MIVIDGLDILGPGYDVHFAYSSIEESSDQMVANKHVHIYWLTDTLVI